MGSEAVSKAVAKKLKYYVDIKRREDGFDLSGPYLPQQDPVHLRNGPTLAYDGLHDRSLKHYFKNPEVKRQVGKMTVPIETKSSRESEIRRYLDTEMAKRSYKFNSRSPYVSPMQRNTPKHRPRALISVDEYLKTKKGSQRRKVKPDVVGKPQKVVRRSPPRKVCKNEHERLVNMAARLIVATETAALPGNRPSQTNQDSSTYGSSHPEVNSRCSYTEDSSDIENISFDGYPRPPSRAGGPRPKWTPPRSSDSVDSEKSKQKPCPKLLKNSETLSDTSENIRAQTKSDEVFSKKNGTTRPNTAGYGIHKITLKPSAGQSRSRSADVGKRTSRQNGFKDVVDNGGKNGWRKDTQNKKYQISKFKESSDEKESKKVNKESDLPLFYKISQHNKTPSRYRILTYDVYVVTGNRSGASTNTDVKLTLFGDNGSSGERCLFKSMNHSHKFRKGQIDIFPIDSVYLGDLQNIRIGHAQSSSEKGWFLEKIFVSEGAKENRVFEFPCKRWFSSQKDDGQIIRDIGVSQLLTESELTESLDDYGSPVEDTTDDGSDASYSSFESADETKEEKIVSSEEEETPEKETRQESRVGRRNKKGKESGEKDRKKMVSFVKDGDKQSEDEKSKLEDEESYNSDTERAEEDNTKESNAEDENTGVKKTERDDDSYSDADRSGKEEKKPPGVSNSEDKDAGVKKTDAEDSRNKSLDDDFWSNISEKGDPIQYDLGVDDEMGNDGKISGPRSSTPAASSEVSPKNSDNEREDNEEHGRITELRKGEENDDGAEKKKTSDKNEEGMGENPREENVKKKDDNKEYMTGFLAGVRASDSHQNEEEPGDDIALNKSMEDGDFTMSKGPSLHSAVTTGNVERVKELLKHNPSLKGQTDEKGWTPLHLGCANGQLDCIKVLAVSGGNLEQETPTGYTSMHLAAMNGHVNCMMVLFGLGAEISCRTIDEYTPLHVASMSGHVECVKWLLANRVKYDAMDANGRTPIEIAEEYCHEEIENLLRSFGEEMTRTDSTLAHLMTYEGRRKKSTDSGTSETRGTYRKVADSGVGGLGSGEESWVSDNDDEDEENEAKGSSSIRPSSGKGRPSSARRRPSSARSDDSVTSMNRTDSITTIKEKQELYQKQRQQMKKRKSSFLDSIRMDVEDDIKSDS